MNKLVNFIEYNNDFEWDYRLHFPIPTLNYITSRTGEDLLNHFDTELEAKGSVVSITRSAKNLLFFNRLDMKAWEYYMAHDVNLIYDVLEYVLEVINFAIISGDYLDFYKVMEGKRKSLALESAKKSLLGASKIVPINAKIRVDY